MADIPSATPSASAAPGHFVLHCLDHAQALPLRLRNYEAHKAYLDAARIKIVISGPLMSDDGATMIGSFSLVEAASRIEVEAFNAADPFRTAGIWRDVQIHAFNKRVDRR